MFSASSALPCRSWPHLASCTGRPASRIPFDYTFQTTPFVATPVVYRHGYYIQDDWKLTRSLTANVGCAGKYFGRPVERDNGSPVLSRNRQQVFPGQMVPA